MPNASEMANSNEILSLYKHDERAALQKLFDIYYEPLLLYCYRLIRDSESAEDIVQDCFVHIWRSRRLENFEGELDRFMFQAIKFRAINYVRDQYRRDRLADNISEENDELPTYFQEEEAGKEIELLHYTNEDSLAIFAGALDTGYIFFYSTFYFYRKIIKNSGKNLFFFSP